MEFKVIIAGGRDFNDFPTLCATMDTLLVKQLETSEIVIISGGARGADSVGESYAKLRGFRIIRKMANWNMHGKAAGFIRNCDMLSIADGVVCFWNGVSKGTLHMINITTKTDKPLRIVRY